MHQLIINNYKERYSIFKDPLLKLCKEQDDLYSVIVIAAKSIDLIDKKHIHQRRVSSSNLDLLAIRLIAIKDKIAHSKTFDQIYNIISELVLEKRELKGIGRLTIYDVSLRIGYYLNTMPEKIYLQAGSKIGAKKLKVKIKNNIALKSNLPYEFIHSDLCEADLENLLCIYRKEL